MVGNWYNVKVNSSSWNEGTLNSSKKAYESIKLTGKSKYADKYRTPVIL